MPPLTSQNPDNSELETLIVQNERHHEEAMDSLQILIEQNEKNNPEPVLESALQTQAEILSETKELKALQNETVSEIKRLSEREEELVGQMFPLERGSRFLGRFKTSGDLPDPEKARLQMGDYAYVEETGEIWRLET